jgi:nucleotide-binding universal stress UspA family protein
VAIKDILLPLVGDPSPAAIVAIEKCVAMAANIGARITAVAIEVDVAVRPTVMTSADPDNGETVEAMRSVSNASGLLAAFDRAAIRLGACSEQSVRRLPQPDMAAQLAHRARLSDLTVVPVKPHDAQLESIIERLIFESGRPILLCPEELAARLAPTFDNIAIAWDHSAPAARAIADSLPLLQAAASVRIFTVTDAATAAELGSGAALAGHLALHGVAANFETVKRGGSSVGRVLGTLARAHTIDLLVMGAYRHSRLNEWVWGGASNTVIGEPPCWVMMSH